MFLFVHLSENGIYLYIFKKIAKKLYKFIYITIIDVLKGMNSFSQGQVQTCH